MKNNPQISVIMSVYNQKNKSQLDIAIQSVLQQTFHDFEFIIYNDGSDREVSEYLQKYMHREDFKSGMRLYLINELVKGLNYDK